MKHILTILFGLTLASNMLSMEQPPRLVETIVAKPYKKNQALKDLSSLRDAVCTKILNLCKNGSTKDVQLLLANFAKIKLLPADIQEYFCKKFAAENAELLEEINHSQGVIILEDFRELYDSISDLDENTLYVIHRLPRGKKSVLDTTHAELLIINCSTNTVETCPTRLPASAYQCFNFPNKRYIGINCSRTINATYENKILILDRELGNCATLWQSPNHQNSNINPVIIENNLRIREWNNTTQQLEETYIAIDDALYSQTTSEPHPLHIKRAQIPAMIPADTIHAHPCNQGTYFDLTHNGIAKRIILPMHFNERVYPWWLSQETNNPLLRDWFIIRSSYADGKEDILINALTGEYIFRDSDNCRFKFTDKNVLGFTIKNGTLLCQDILSREPKNRSTTKPLISLMHGKIQPLQLEYAHNNPFLFTIENGVLKKYTNHFVLLKNASASDLCALLIAHELHTNNEQVPEIILNQLTSSTNTSIKALATRYTIEKSATDWSAAISLAVAISELI